VRLRRRDAGEYELQRGAAAAGFPEPFLKRPGDSIAASARLIADQAYGGRMGNARPPSDDGWNFRGQGFSQLTGRDNYDMVSRMVGLDPKLYPQFHADHANLSRAAFVAKYPIVTDLLSHPELIISPQHAFEIGIADFVYCGCLPYAQRDNLLGVSSLLNVGHLVSDPNKINGYAMRAHWLGLWKHAMAVV
jgi:putative chitinase